MYLIARPTCKPHLPFPLFFLLSLPSHLPPLYSTPGAIVAMPPPPIEKFATHRYAWSRTTYNLKWRELKIKQYK
jgi:hypothetical protein